jgi:lipopolysaccharide biosynthesis glycosyltransferase
MLDRRLHAHAKPAARERRGRDGFITNLERTGDLDLAAVAAARPLLRRGRVGRLRTVAQVLQRSPSTRVAGDVTRAMLALHDGQHDVAWQLLRVHEPARILKLAPAELFRAGFSVAPDEAAGLLRRVEAGEIECAIGPRAWCTIANLSFAAGDERLSAWALDRAVAGAPAGSPVVKDAAALRRWYDRRPSLDCRLPALEHGQTAIAVLTEVGPGRAGAARRAESDPGQLAIVDAVGRLPGTQLYRVSRDATSYFDVPRGTWLIVTGRLPLPLFGIRTDLPYDERYRPVFASIRVSRIDVLTPAVLDQLRACGPVGCADWDTYYLMRAANVPAFLDEAVPTAVETVIAHIAGGADDRAVYDAWRSATDQAVTAGIALDVKVEEPMPIGLDVAAVSRGIRARSVVAERSESGSDQPEVNLEFSLDGNLKHHMVVVLDSIVRRTSRPIRLFVLCRDHGAGDFERMAELFPTVSFVWLPTDEVDYGRLPGMIRHITVATMDRLLLPELLDDVDRVVHHDLDAVCLTDIAELADLEMRGHPIAAVTTARAQYRSGLGEFRSTAYRLRKQGDPELARELMARSHLRHRLDFEVFNAGVMVLDLARMRSDSFCREFFPYAERFGMNDQAVLNAYAGADRLVLDPSWNWCPRLEDMAEPRIAHWSGPVKPWQDRWVNGQEIWKTAEALAATRSRTPRATALAK